MTELLVLRPDGDAPGMLDWIVVTDTGVPVGGPGRGDAIAAASTAAGRRVIGLVPSVDVLRTHAEVPVRGAARILQALPYALEEQLAEDIETLHFAAGERDADGRVPVAVVRHDKMQAWRARLETDGIELAALHTEGDALGDIPSTTVLLAEGSRLTLRDTDGTISTGDIDNAAVMLDLWLASKRSPPDEGDDTRSPINLLVYATPDAHLSLEPALGRVRSQLETVDVKLLADGVLPRLAAQLATDPGINLLQGEYARRSNYRGLLPAWRLSAGLAAGLFVAFIGYKLIENARLESRATALDTAIESAFRYTFPDVSSIQDPRAQFESRLKALGRSPRAKAGPGFLDALLQISQAVATDTGSKTKIEAIDFRGDTLELRILAPDVEALDRVQKEITKGGELAAEIQSANPEGEQVLGRIKITMGA